MTSPGGRHTLKKTNHVFGAALDAEGAVQILGHPERGVARVEHGGGAALRGRRDGVELRGKPPHLQEVVPAQQLRGRHEVDGEEEEVARRQREGERARVPVRKGEEEGRRGDQSESHPLQDAVRLGVPVALQPLGVIQLYVERLEGEPPRQEVLHDPEEVLLRQSVVLQDHRVPGLHQLPPLADAEDVIPLLALEGVDPLPVPLLPLPRRRPDHPEVLLQQLGVLVFLGTAFHVADQHLRAPPLPPAASQGAAQLAHHLEQVVEVPPFVAPGRHHDDQQLGTLGGVGESGRRRRRGGGALPEAERVLAPVQALPQDLLAHGVQEHGLDEEVGVEQPVAAQRQDDAERHGHQDQGLSDGVGPSQVLTEEGSPSRHWRTRRTEPRGDMSEQRASAQEGQHVLRPSMQFDSGKPRRRGPDSGEEKESGVGASSRERRGGIFNSVSIARLRSGSTT
ncbi:hypothetical protein EYF80_041746 [Liparis tanakae]|uniref:Uncharacterized protein n=1 Tax=Liparis tanakae TaxID=230148 RepID=A0A4Z2G407_9TELE|nr:hypothetical protein EYF80_041746 [Liparis tanakae]